MNTEDHEPETVDEPGAAPPADEDATLEETPEPEADASDPEPDEPEAEPETEPAAASPVAENPRRAYDPFAPHEEEPVA